MVPPSPYRKKYIEGKRDIDEKEMRDRWENKQRWESIGGESEPPNSTFATGKLFIIENFNLETSALYLYIIYVTKKFLLDIIKVLTRSTIFVEINNYLNFNRDLFPCMRLCSVER